MKGAANVKILFVAGFGPIIRDTGESRKLYGEVLGIPFKEERKWKTRLRGSEAIRFLEKNHVAYHAETTEVISDLKVADVAARAKQFSLPSNASNEARLEASSLRYLVGA